MTVTRAKIQHLILAVSLSVLSLAQAQAQSLNSRWFGTWQSNDGKLEISEKQFKMGKELCRWSNTEPQQVKGCVAFYSGSTSKKSMQEQYVAAEKAINEMLADKSIAAKQKNEMRATLKQNKQAVEQLSNDTFKVVQYTTPDMQEGSGDCGTVFFIDKDTLYKSSNCAPAPDAFTVTPYKKVN